ncbi:MAG TPA: hypothetical protein VK978_03570 [Candidatus Saccharimonadales bacterium]|nr:hypothetical protein [Candidatus Saccharimonadales bacterium]
MKIDLKTNVVRLNRPEQKALSMEPYVPDFSNEVQFPLEHAGELRDHARTMKEGWLSAVAPGIAKPPLSYRAHANWAASVEMVIDDVLIKSVDPGVEAAVAAERQLLSVTTAEV